MQQIDTIWERIETHAGTEFHMIRGGGFRYSIVAGHVIPERTRNRSRNHISKKPWTSFR